MLKCIFDLDGTIVDSSPEILRCLQQAFGEVNISLQESLSPFIIGPPIQHIVCSLRPDLPAETVQSICLNFRRLYDGVTDDIGAAQVGYQIQITALQEAGDDYSTTLTYIATPTF